MKSAIASIIWIFCTSTSIAQTCSGTITTVDGSTWLKHENSCGLHPELVSTCGGAVALTADGASIYALPVGTGHGDIEFEVLAIDSFTPFMVLQKPDGCGATTGCVFADSATTRFGGNVIDFLPAAAPEGTYYLIVSDVTDESAPRCGEFALVVSGEFGVRDQTIMFRTLVPTNATAGGEYQAIAKSSSGLPLDWSIDPASTSDCHFILANDTVAKIDFTKTGTCTVYINQSGDAGYNPAVQMQQTFVVHPAAPVSLLISPDALPNGFAGSPLSDTITVTEYDKFGNVVTTDETSSISLSSNGPGSLRGAPLSQVVTDGVATYIADLVFDTAGDYTLTASDSVEGVASATSANFLIVPASAATLQFTPVPASSIESGATLGSVTVTEFDQFGNRMIADNSTVVTLSVNLCGGVPLGAQPLTAGKATFEPLVPFRAAATHIVLNATPGIGSTAPASASFDVSANTDLVFFDGYESCNF